MEGDCRGSEEGSREACVLPRVADWKLCQRAALLLWCGVVCVRGGLVCLGFGKDGQGARYMVNLVPNNSKRLPAHISRVCLPSLPLQNHAPISTHTGHTQRQEGIHCRLSFPAVPASWSRPQASVSSSSSFSPLPPTQNTAHTHPCRPRQEEARSSLPPPCSSSSPSSSSHRTLSKPACRWTV